MTTILANPISINTTVIGIGSAGVPPSTTGESITYDCAGYNRLGIVDQGIINLFITQAGENLTTYHAAAPIEISTTVHGEYIKSNLHVPSPIQIALFIRQSPTYTTTSKTNWVAWSKIGRYDFTKDQSNVAGERPMEWKGQVYAIKKLGASVIVYGADGISIMTPSEINWGMQTTHLKGIYSKHAVAGTDDIHWFVDNDSVLWQVTSAGFKRLGYKNSLLGLSTVYMHYDALQQLLYINSGSTGFVYNTINGSMGMGLETLSGIGYQYGTSYAVSPQPLALFGAVIQTGVLDFGTRKRKTIFNIEVHSDIATPFMGYIAYRNDVQSSFASTPIFYGTPQNIIYCPCSGVEFMIALGATESVTSGTLDQIKVNGVIEGYSPLDPYIGRYNNE